MPILQNNNQKIFWLLFLFGTICFTGLYGSKIADRIVAVVGNEVILQSELLGAVNFLKLTKESLPPDSILYREVLDELIKNQLLLVAAQKESIVISRQEIEEELEKNLLLLRQNYRSTEEFDSVLKREGLTERTLKERYRSEIRKRLLGQKLLAKKGILNLSVSAREIYEFYETHKESLAKRPAIVSLAHLFYLIKPSLQNESLAQRRTSEIYDIILRGGDFEEVAKSFSEDRRTQKVGGYLGKFHVSELSSEMRKVIETLKTGEVSLPFRIQGGYEIVKCISKKRDSVELAHIFIGVKITKEDTIRAKKFLERLRNEIIKGRNFDSLVLLYSDDPFTKDSSGYLGEFTLENLQEPFRTVVKKLHTGEVSEPVLSEHGFHLIKVLKKEEERYFTLAELQNEIREYLISLKTQEKLDDYLLRIAQRTYIEKHFY
ncbi:MAG: peptidylprolyl isomerase [candidate division WOR-3 bacterium]|nr:peptidylprolyl isomerase [candidate division WOR-3 bacterium]MDW7987438.1 peptidylprolyl isomerase [candidate division WOR-3 bacterium]